MRLNELNKAPEATARAELEQCCAAPTWITTMVQYRPFADMTALQQAAKYSFDQLSDNDWLSAFAAHPMIGDIQSLRAKYANTAAQAAGEQSATQSAPEPVLAELAEANKHYAEKFGFIFIVFASGKTAEQMLALLQARLPNNKETELQIAANEQRKITALRLERFL